MRPMRSFGGGGGFPGLETMASKLALGLVAGSVMYLLTRGAQGALLLLVPGFIGSFLWQPITYAFIETTPIGIIFGAIIIWSIGGFLESIWGSKRLLLVALGSTALAAILTALVGLVVPAMRGVPYAGGTVLTTLLWVSYGLTIGRGQTSFWGIPLSGNALAGIGAGFVVLSVLTGGANPLQGLLLNLPDVFILFIAFAYVRGASPRRLWLQLQHWRLQRQLRNRSRNLRVVSPDRPDDRFLN
jgi:membrane associated rhomboid family serine protease